MTQDIVSKDQHKSWVPSEAVGVVWVEVVDESSPIHVAAVVARTPPEASCLAASAACHCTRRMTRTPMLH